LLDVSDLHHKLKTFQPKIFALTHVSNTLGTLNSIEVAVHLIKEVSPQTKILVDGAQAAPHIPINFQQLDVDFYTVSAHKMLGPMGMGGLFVRKSLLSEMTPFLFGGGMIHEVNLNGTTFAEDLEERFTAGTPDVAGLVGWAAACEYLSKIGMRNLLYHDQQLVIYTLQELQKIPQIHIVGSTVPEQRVGSVAFLYDGVHAHDVSQILDSEGVAVRSGQHCTMPLHLKYDWGATTRVSFQLYNTTEDIDVLVKALQKVGQIFGK
jgi:cysteine desulfurase/selenocysteine lyase